MGGDSRGKAGYLTGMEVIVTGLAFWKGGKLDRGQGLLRMKVLETL